MAVAVAEAGNTAIALYGAPFPLPLHSQLTTQQANNNKGSEEHSRVLPHCKQPPESAGARHLGVTGWTARTVTSVAMMTMITTSWQRTAKIQLAKLNVGQLDNLFLEFAKSCLWDASRAVTR